LKGVQSPGPAEIKTHGERVGQWLTVFDLVHMN
jgi:hypothetical protein